MSPSVLAKRSESANLSRASSILPTRSRARARARDEKLDVSIVASSRANRSPARVSCARAATLNSAWTQSTAVARPPRRSTSAFSFRSATYVAGPSFPLRLPARSTRSASCSDETHACVRAYLPCCVVNPLCLDRNWESKRQWHPEWQRAQIPLLLRCLVAPLPAGRDRRGEGRPGRGDAIRGKAEHPKGCTGRTRITGRRAQKPAALRSDEGEHVSNQRRGAEGATRTRNCSSSALHRDANTTLNAEHTFPLAHARFTPYAASITLTISA
jgi:hypothetical protein